MFYVQYCYWDNDIKRDGLQKSYKTEKAFINWYNKMLQKYGNYEIGYGFKVTHGNIKALKTLEKYNL